MNTVLLALLLLVQGVVVPGPQTGTVEGRVLNQDGTPAARVRVTAQTVAESPAAAAEAPVLNSIVQSDASGRFRLEGVAPGRYYIGAGLVEFPTYYPGVTALTGARVVTVAAGSALTGIDFGLARPTGLKVSGHVKRDASAVATPQPLRVLMTGGGAGARNVVVPADGSFEFTDVPPGRYTIGVSPMTGSQPQNIVLNDRDVQIDLIVLPTVALNGKVVVADNGARPRVNLTLVDGATRFNVGVSPTGTFSVQLPPGNFLIAPGPLPEGFTVKSITAGSMDLLTQPIRVAVGVPLPDFVVAVDVSSPPPWVKVSGRVRGGIAVPGRPGANTISMTGQTAGEILQATINPDGTFEFPRVIPGLYSVRANAVAFAIQPLQITVGNSDLDGVEIALPGTVEVTGRVTIEGGGPRGGPTLRLALTTSASGLPGRTMTATVSRDGAFTITLPEGEQQVSLATILTGLNGYVVKSMTYGAVNLLTSPMKIDTASASKELLITFAPSGTSSGVKVSGHVTNTVGGLVSITLSGGGLRNDGPIATNSNGEFEIPNVLPGNYTLRTLAGTPGIDIAVPIVVVAGKDLGGVEIAVPPQKNVRGRIALDDVAGLRPRFWFVLTGKSAVTAYATTEADGSFTTRLPLGDWNVTVGGLPAGLVLKSLTYGEASLVGNPLKVAADDTQELRVVVATTAANPLVKVSGRLIPATPEQRALPQLRGIIPSITFTGPLNIQSPISAPEGTFEFPKVLPGTYNSCCNFGWTSITIPNKDVADLNLRFVTGRVVMESGNLDSNASMRAYDGHGTSAANVVADGSFIFILAEGSYQMTMSPLPVGFTIKSIRYGSDELRNQTLEMMPNKEPLTLTVTLGPRR